jgi:ankyrin repeat protein
MKQNFNEKAKEVPFEQVRALSGAIQRGDTKGVLDVLKKYPEAVDASDGTFLESTPLIIAGAAHNEDMVRLLLQHGANPNKGDSGRRTPLALAAAGGQTEIVRLLLDKGAHIESRQGTYTAEQTPLLQAVRSLHLDTVQLLLTRGANVNAAYRGITLLDMVHGNLEDFDGNKADYTAARQIETLIKQKLDLQSRIFKRAKLEVR